jgi:hypothetical protein
MRGITGMKQLDDFLAKQFNRIFFLLSGMMVSSKTE